MKRCITLTLLFGCCLLHLMSLSAAAAVPQLINYQGRLTNSVGTPLDTTVALVFQIYADSNGVTSLWDETHPSVTITDGLFQVLLGSVSPIGQDVFTGDKRWLGVRLSGGTATALIPLVSTAYSYRANVSDTASLAKSVADNAITSAKIQNGTISFADIGQNSATNGQVMKWNGSAWTAQADATSGSNLSGWVDNGTVVELQGSSDTVAINTTSRIGKLNINGDLGLNGSSSIKFGNDAIRISALGGNDMRLVADELSMLTTGDITFGEFGVDTWVKFDNANKRVGIGTTTADERLQVENEASGGRSFLQIETSHPTGFGEAGIRFKTPQNTWHLRMDDYTNNNLQDGALGLRSQVGVEAMTWLEGGNVGVGTTNPLRKLHVNGSALIADSLGIGTTSPTKKLHVYGSAMIKDTLYAGAIDPSLMSAAHLPDEPGVAVGTGTPEAPNGTVITGDYAAYDSASISVPGSGYVVGLSTVTLRTDHSGSDLTWIYTAISSSPTGTAGSRVQMWQLDNNINSGIYRVPASIHRVFSVAAAGTYKYYAIGASAGDDVVKAEGSTLTLIYVPTAYGAVSAAQAAGATSPEQGTLFGSGESTSLVPTVATDYAEKLSKLESEVEILKKRLDEQKK